MKILIIEEANDLGVSIKEYLEELGHDVKLESQVNQINRDIVENFDAYILGLPIGSLSKQHLERLDLHRKILKGIILDPSAVVSRTTQNHVVVLPKPFSLRSLALALV